MRPVPGPAGYRARWLAQRARHGRHRPEPTNLRLANAGSVTFRPEKTARVVAAAFETPSAHGRPHVIGFCELADVDAATIASEAWQVVQHGPTGSPQSALGLAARLDVARLAAAELRAGTKATSEGGGFRARPILTARIYFRPGTLSGWSRTTTVGHAPAARAPEARRRYLARFAEAAGSIEMGDLNIRHRWAARLLGKKVYSAGVLHIAIPRWIPSRVTRVDIDSDHPALDVQLWPKKETR